MIINNNNIILEGGLIDLVKVDGGRCATVSVPTTALRHSGSPAGDRRRHYVVTTVTTHQWGWSVVTFSSVFILHFFSDHCYCSLLTGLDKLTIRQYIIVQSCTSTVRDILTVSYSLTRASADESCDRLWLRFRHLFYSLAFSVLLRIAEFGFWNIT